jgi:ubiquitin C-terminal hydrolase
MDRIIIGIENINNSCYLNSVLQLLFTIDPFNSFIKRNNNPEKKIGYKYKMGNEEKLLEVYGYLIDNTHTINNNQFNTTCVKTTIDDDNVLDSLQFKVFLNKLIPIGNNQQDAHEILIHILSFFHEALKCKIYETRPRLPSEDDINRLASNHRRCY